MTKKLTILVFITIFYFSPSSKAENIDVYQSELSNLVFDQTPFKKVLHEIFNNYRTRYPSLPAPTLVLVERTDSWGQVKITAEFKKMSFGEILAAVCNAASVDILIMGDTVIVSKRVRDRVSTIITLPDNTKIGDALIKREASDKEIEEILGRYVTGESYSEISIARLGASDKFVVTGSLGAVEIVQSISFLSLRNIQIGNK